MNTCVLKGRKSASGSTSESEARPTTIPARLRANAALPDVADFLCLQHAGRRDECFSYRTVLREAERFAALYQQRGLSRGDQVVVILPHSLDLYTSFLGALLGGLIPSIWSIPSPKIAEAEYSRMLAALLANARPKLLVTYQQLRERLAGAGAIRRADIRVCVPDELPAACNTPTPVAMPDPDGTAFLQYSSGTTGTKKGVAISHRALLWQVDHYAEAIGLRDDDRIVSWLPLYHDMGLIACLFLPFLRRAAIVAMCPFEWVQWPAMWLRAISDSRATLSWLPNFAFSFLSQNVTDAELAGLDLSSLRGVVNCSEPILVISHADFLRRFGPAGFRASALCGSYAMAENTFAVTSGGFDAPLRQDCIDGREFARSGRAIPIEASSPDACVLVSSGTALPETDIRIVDTDGCRLPERRLGEIVLRSPCLLSEYHNNQDATGRALRDGVYYSGDVGYLADGQLYVTARKNDMLIIRGQNIYPQDVETIVSETPGVIPGRTAAVGVPNEQVGTQDLVILAETHEHDPAKRDGLGREIFRRVSQALEITPADVFLVEHMWLRKSTAGKISRAINRDRYLAALRNTVAPNLRVRRLGLDNLQTPDSEVRRYWDPATAEPARAGTQSTLAQVRRCVERVLLQTRPGGRTSVSDDEPLITSGLIDSLGLVALINALETDFHISIKPESLADTSRLDTLRCLAELVDRLRAGGPAGDKPLAVPRTRADVPLLIGRPRRPRRVRGFWSWYYSWLLRRRGARVGRGLRVLGPLILRFDGDPRNITIGNDVTLMPWVDLKIRENGKIILHDGVVLDTNVRLVAANDGRIELGEDAQVGMATVINAGEDVIIGRRTAIAGFSLIEASEHNYLGKEPILEQGYHHEPVYIGADVWVAAHVYIGIGSHIGDGAVLGNKSTARGDVPANSVALGDPARVVRFRG